MSFLTDETLFAGTLNDSDLLHLVDVSNTTQNAAGSSFKLTIGQLKSGIATIYSANGTLSAARNVTQAGFNLSFTGGNIGIRTTPDADSTLHVKGVDNTLPNKSAKFCDSNGNVIFSVSNSKVACAGIYGNGNTYPGLAYAKAKILAVNIANNSAHDMEVFCDDTTSEMHFGSRFSYNFWVHTQGLVYKYNATDYQHEFNRSLLVQNLIGSGGGGGAGDFLNIATAGTQYGVKGNATGASTKNVGGYFTSSGGATNFALQTDGRIKSVNLPTYADNAAALVGGLLADDEYKTVTGERRIVV